jgi:hypothetical protein
VANCFFVFLRFKQYLNIFRSSLVLFAFVLNSHQAQSLTPTLSSCCSRSQCADTLRTNVT